MEFSPTSHKILIVDDEPVNVQLLEQLLIRHGYRNLRSTNDGRETIPLYLEFQPDLILLDLMMPVMDGFQVMNLLRQVIASSNFVPILVLTADASRATRERALAHGAIDFLTKPFDMIEISLRIKNLLHTRQLYRQVEAHRRQLEEEVLERTQELEESRIQILARLALAAEYRDDDTGQHTQRVGRSAALLASALGMAEAEMLNIRRAAPLHDVGKIGIPDHILLKPGKLTPAEYEVMKGHSAIGARILRDENVPLLRMAETIALTHHERWDGTGYPNGLAGEDIPLVGRIVAVADVYDALTHARPYKPAWPKEQAIAEIELQSGRQFDPTVVRAFLELTRAGLWWEAESMRNDESADVGRRGAAPRVAAQPRGLAEPQPAFGATAADPPLAVELLTRRESEVLRLLAQGQTNREIAQALYVSVGTVKVHVERILGKLGVSDRTQAAVRAMELGLLQLRPE